MKMRRALIVEPLAIVAVHIEDLVSDLGVQAQSLASPSDALMVLEQINHDGQSVVIFGSELGDDDLLAFVEAVVATGADIIVMSTRAESISDAVKSRCLAVLEKPFAHDDLIAHLSDVLSDTAA